MSLKFENSRFNVDDKPPFLVKTQTLDRTTNKYSYSSIFINPTDKGLQIFDDVDNNKQYDPKIDKMRPGYYDMSEIENTKAEKGNRVFKFVPQKQGSSSNDSSIEIAEDTVYSPTEAKDYFYEADMNGDGKFNGILYTTPEDYKKADVKPERLYFSQFHAFVKRELQIAQSK